MRSDRRRSRSEDQRRRATAPLLLGLGLAYMALSLGVWQLADPTELSAAWWPAAGLTLGVLCRVRRKDWPAVLAVVFAADVAADLIQGASLATSLGWATANTVEPLLGALAFGRLFRGEMPNIESPANVLRFFAVALFAGAPLASFIGAMTSSLSYDLAFLEQWRLWYVGDVLGIVVVAPVVLYAPQIRAALDLRFALVLAGLAVVVVLPFVAPADVAVAPLYVITPVLVVTALLAGAPGAIAGGLVMAAIADVLSALGEGPFGLREGSVDTLVELQVFTAVELLTVFLVVALRAELLSARAHAEQLTEEQLRDPLTGTGSRLLVEEALADVASEPTAGQARPSAAVLYLDLDEFKPVNDAHGHAAGDAVLRAVAERVRDAVRDTDVVGRVGGDEFVVVCRAITPEELERLADRVRRRVEEPIAFDGADIRVGASVGTSWAAGPLLNPADLLRRADKDMYRRKLVREQARRDPSTA